MSPPDVLKRQYRVEAKLEQLPVLDRYSAYDLKAHRSVTLHVLGNLSTVLRQRVAKSLELLRKIQHPHLLPVLEYGELEEGRRYYWTTPQYNTLFTSGGDPSAQLTSPSQLLTMLKHVLQALTAAHAADLIHHRIRWEALVSAGGRVCILDFGVPQHCLISDEKRVASVHADGKIADIMSALTMSLSVALSHGQRSQEAVLATPWIQLSGLLRDLVEKVQRLEFRSAPDVEKAILGFHVEDDPRDTKGNRDHRSAVVETALKNISTYQPVLASVLREAPPSEKLADTIVLHINHSLDDVFLLDKLFNSLFAKSVFVTVPYGRQRIPSNHPGSVYHASFLDGTFELLCSGKPIGERAASFGKAMERLITRSLRDAVLPALTTDRQLLIIEDGGYHYQPLRRCLEENLISADSIIGVVEQTMAGAIQCANAIRDYGVPYPALTIARSDLKMRYEAFFIGRRVVDELAYLLYHYDEFLAHRQILIIGYGVIGRSVALSLEGMACEVSVIDIYDDIKDVARQDGFEVVPSDLPGFFTSEAVVVGATGESSFSLRMLAEFAHSPSNRVFLVSASSKRVEFAAVIDFFEGGEEGRQNSVGMDGRLGVIDSIRIEHTGLGVTYLFKCAGRDKAVVLVARGFPVNFYREGGFSLTMSMIDPINTELVLLGNYAVGSRKSLESNRLYALGFSPLPSLSVLEEEVLVAWRATRGLAEHTTSGGIWSGFPIHPAEDYLRLRRLEGTWLVR